MSTFISIGFRDFLSISFFFWLLFWVK
jgi:hypothetical protein